MPARVSGGGRKFQRFCGGWNKWEAQAANLQHIRDLETMAKNEKAGTGGHDESQQRQMAMLRMAPTFDGRTDEEIAGLLYVARTGGGGW